MRDFERRAGVMIQGQRIAQLIHDVLRALSQARQIDRPMTPATSTILLGKGGSLDSLGFVNFSVALEDAIRSEYSADVSLIDIVTESSQDRWTVSDLAEHIAECLGSRSV